MINSDGAAIVFGVVLPSDLGIGDLAGYPGSALFEGTGAGEAISLLSEGTVLITLIADDAVMDLPFAGQGGIISSGRRNSHEPEQKPQGKRFHRGAFRWRRDFERRSV